MTKEQRQTVLQAVKMISGRCDGAHEQDGVGFNGGDAHFGNSLAACQWLSDGQARPALKMVLRYPKQIGPEMVASLKAIQDSEAVELHKIIDTAVTIESVLAILEFGEGKKISTRAGDRILKKAKPSEAFWNIWRHKKEEIKALGFSIGKNQTTGEFEVCQWINVDGSSNPARQEEPAAPVVAPPKAVLQASTVAKLLDYQPNHVATLVAALKQYGVAFDGSETGTGKTYGALAAALELNLKVWVLTPKAVIPSWKRAAKLMGVQCFAINYEAIKTGKTGMGKWVTEGEGKKAVEKFVWEIPDGTMIVFDECHRCKAIDTQNAELLIQAKASKVPILLLSATAADNPLQMRAFAYTLGLYNSPTKSAFYKWAIQNGCVKGRWGFEFIGGKPQLNKIHREIFEPGRGSRIRIADVPNFPKTQIFPTLLDFNGAASKIQDAYEEMERELANLDEVEAKDRQGVILTQILRARMRAEFLKAPTLGSMAEDAIEEGMSVAIFVNFDDTIEALARILKTECVIRGGQSDEDRQRNIDRFQAGDFPRLSLICPTFSAQDIKQAFGRVWRAVSGKEEFPAAPVSRIILCNIRAGGVGVSLHNLRGIPSIQKVVFAEGTIEEQACDALKQKIHRMDTLNDGDLAMGINLRGNALV